MNTKPYSRRRSSLTRLVSTVTASALIALAFVSVGPSPSADAVTGADFDPGYIIDDTQFYDGNAMSEAQIQGFLESRQQGVCGNSLCLKNFRETTLNRPQRIDSDTGRLRCNSYAGRVNETAASIIFKAQQACGISAKVLLVTLHKEQGLITKLAPADSAMKRAMGYACPDTAPCAATSLGFGNQVYLAALQFNTYRASNFGSYKPGTNTVKWHPNTACGSSTFNIASWGTAALYNYTPYRPNAAALANLSGIGDGCSSYGNRNFWVFFNSWFGSPTGSPTGQATTITVGPSNKVRVAGWAVDPDAGTASTYVRVRGANWSKILPANQSSDGSLAAFPAAGRTHGFSADVYAAVGNQVVCVDAVNWYRGSDTELGCATVNVSSTVRVDARLAGDDRYATAIAISTQSFPAGVPVVYVASGENFPDALSATPVAASAGAPVLLTPRSEVPAILTAELRRLQPTRIVLVGGEAAISSDVEAELETIAPVERRAGLDRLATSISVSDEVGGKRSGIAYLVSGATFPDALTAASVAGFKDSPMVLADSGSAVSPALTEALQRWGVRSIVVVGGTSVISDTYLAALRGVAGITEVRRVAGADRYATSIALNQATYPAHTIASLANAGVFADGLAGGAVAGRDGTPLYISGGSCIPSDIIDRLVASGTRSVTLLGGRAALSANVEVLVPCS